MDSRLQEVMDACSHMLRVVGECWADGLLLGEEGASGCWQQGAQGYGEHGGWSREHGMGVGSTGGWRGALGGLVQKHDLDFSSVAASG